MTSNVKIEIYRASGLVAVSSCLIGLLSQCPANAQASGSYFTPCDPNGNTSQAVVTGPGGWALGYGKAQLDNSTSYPESITDVYNFTGFAGVGGPESLTWSGGYNIALGLPFSNYLTLGGTAYDFDETATGIVYFSVSVGTPPVSTPINGSTTISDAGETDGYFKWIGPGPAPKTQEFLVTDCIGAYNFLYSQIEYVPDGCSASSTFADSFDNIVTTNDGVGTLGGAPFDSVSKVSSHLVIASCNSSGVYEVYIKANGNESIVNTLPGSASLAAELKAWAGLQYVWARPDTRTVSVNSSLGLTYHTSSPGGGNGTKVPDLLSGNSINANTVVPERANPNDRPIDETITYNATPQGGWGNSSAYIWSITLGVPPLFQSSSGTFTMPGDPPDNYSAFYSDDYPGLPGAATPGTQENVSIALTDSVDSAQVSGYYNLLFHAPVENWQVSTAPNGVISAPTTLIGTSISTPGGFPTSIAPMPDEEDYSVPLQAAGGVFTAAPAVMTAFFDPPAAVVTLFTIAGYTLALSTPPPALPPLVVVPGGDQAQWDQDVQTELAVTCKTYTGFMPTTDRMPAQVAQDVSKNGDASYWGAKATFAVSYTVSAYQEHNQITYVGDGYNTQGYFGPETGTISIPIAVNDPPYLYLWTVAGGKP